MPMHLCMATDFVSSRFDFFTEPWMQLGAMPHKKECRLDLVFIEQIEQWNGQLAAGTIVKSQSHTSSASRSQQLDGAVFQYHRRDERDSAVCNDCSRNQSD
jgi:hypothetical protein